MQREARFQKLTRSRMSDQIASAIQASIIDKQFELGERLPSEQELAASFDTSRGTVREALRSLEAMGFVEIRTGAGAFVVDSPLGQGALETRLNWLLDRRNVIIEILDVREALEATAVRGCALHASKSQLRAFERMMKKMHVMVAADEPDQFAVADVEFHVAIAQSSGNHTLSELVEYVLRVYRASNRALTDVRGRTAKSVEEHQVIADALLARDADAAESAMRTHIRSVRAQLAALAENESALSS